MAMQVKHLAKDAAQKWEDEALREARVILAAAVNGPLTDLVLPPLPLALLEVHKSHHKPRPMKPSDIQSPFTQASTSPWAVWMTHEDDPEIPSQIDLGDPRTFWWEGLEKRTTKTVVPVLVPLKDEVTNTSRFGKESEHSSTSSEPDPRSRSSKRYRADSLSSDEDEGRHVYAPKCDRCRDQGLGCHVVRWGQRACMECRRRKRRCSAYQSESRIVSRSPSPIDGKRKSYKRVDRLSVARQRDGNRPVHPSHNMVSSCALASK
ncbi:hypothetical protein J3R83DRAFT_7161 [Lanmaoa asiatica]|nr:hypothetical protein J3R83DRAFT_7161 [Lanmaoa asiatica]